MRIVSVLSATRNFRPVILTIYHLLNWNVPLEEAIPRTIRDILDCPEEGEGGRFTRAAKVWIFDHLER
jgi:hypothetical protein